MKLASTLTRFRTELAEFPDETVYALLPLLTKLSFLLGEPTPDYWGSDGEPDGFDGATTTGTFERLLPSELLLLDAEPDEFLRRSAMREQLFFHLARRAPRSEARVHVFFDAGPSQLGSPRLVHLALMLLFAERARRMRASCRLSVIQGADGPVDWDGREAVLRMLERRSLFEPTATHCREAIDRAESAKHDEVHWVGGRRLRSLAPTLGGRLLEISDSNDARSDRVRITRVTTERDQALELTLPSPRERARLLRNPFEKTGLVGPSAKPDGGWFSNLPGHFVAVGDNSLRSFELDRLPHGMIFERPPGEELVAGELFRQGFCALLRTGERHVFSFRGRRHEVVFEQLRPRFDSGNPLRLHAIGRDGKFPLVLDDDGVVFTTTTPDGFTFRPIVDRVVALATANGSFELLRRRSEDHFEIGRIPVGQAYQAGKIVHVPPEAPSFFHCARGKNLGGSWFLREHAKTSLPDGNHLVRFGVYDVQSRLAEVTVPSDHPVVGARFDATKKSFELVCLHPDRRSLKLGRRVAAFSSSLESVLVSGDGQRLYFRDAEGRHGFYSAHRGTKDYLDGEKA